MPRIACVNDSKLLSTLLEVQKLEIFDENDKLKGPRQPVWLEISLKLNGVMKPNYLYQRIKENRGGLLDRLKEHHLITIKHQKKDGDSEGQIQPTSSSRAESSKFSDEGAVVKPNKMFIVNIPALEWKKMEPVETEYKRRERGKLRKFSVLPQYRWEDVLVSLLWEQHKIPCPYSFDRGCVSLDASKRGQFIKIDAHCTDCGAVGVGRIIHEPVHGEGVTMEWRCEDTRNIPHNKKRCLTRDLRQDVAKDIMKSSPLVYRRKLANQLMDIGDVQPPQLYGKDVLRKAKQQLKDVTADVVHGPDPIMCLELMKHEQPHCGSIHDIGQDKFYVHYYTPSQLHMYRKYCSSEYVVLVVDATGSLATKILRLHGPSEYIFLYQGMMRATSFSCPIIQMLSEKQDANSILYWLNEWERAGAPCPKEAVTDNSAALKSALARSFGRCCDIKEYKEKCFCVLIGENEKLPPCFIRLDVAHYIKAAKAWSAFKDKATSRLRDFYLRCLGLLIKSKALHDFEEILTNILVLLFSESEGKDEDGNEVAMEESLRFLSGKIKGETMVNENDYNEVEHKQTVTGEQVSDSPNCIKDWVQSLKARAKEISTTSSMLMRMNPYYSPEIAEHFIRISHDFTLWSAVMVVHFNSPYLTASSAHVEGEFEILKHKILIGERKPIQPHKLVGLHLQSITGFMKIAGSINLKLESDRKSSPNLLDIDKKKVPVVEITKLSFTESNTADLPEDYQVEKSLVKGPETLHTIDEISYSDRESTTTITSDEEAAPSDLNSYENWRNKMGQKTRKNRKSKFMTPCPELDAALQGKKIKQPRNNLLLNGNKTGFVMTNRNTYVKTSNTCAFDALVSIFANAYIEIEQYRTFLELSPNFLFQAAHSLATVGAVTKTYQLRAEALGQNRSPDTLPSITHGKSSNTLSLIYDCWDNVINMAKELLRDIYSCQVTIQCTEESCQRLNVTNYQILDTDLHVILNEGFGCLGKAIEKSLALPPSGSGNEVQHAVTLTKCLFECVGCPTLVVKGYDHLIIDVDYLGSEHPSFKNCKYNKPLMLKDLPLSLKFDQKEYLLMGVVAYKPGHYTAFTRKLFSQTWDHHDDLSRKVITNVPFNEKILPHVLIYVCRYH